MRARTLRTAAFLLAATPAVLSQEEPTRWLGLDTEGLREVAENLGLRRNPAVAAPATFAEVKANPDGFRSVPVTFTVQFHERVSFWNPFFTRFTPDRYLNFSAWDDTQAPWLEEDYANDFPLFYVDRASPAARVVLQASTFDRLQVVAVIRDMFRGKPWFEVTSATPLPERLAQGTVLHAARAHRLLREGKWSLAESEFGRALVEGMPAGARVALLQDLAACQAAQGESGRATETLRTALKLDRRNRAIAEALDSLGPSREGAAMARTPEKPPATEPAPSGQNEGASGANSTQGPEGSPPSGGTPEGQPPKPESEGNPR